jgi:hypothetical protein
LLDNHPSREIMNYEFVAIPDEDVSQASDPLFQHIVATYASETNKTASMWRAIPDTAACSYKTQRDALGCLVTAPSGRNHDPMGSGQPHGATAFIATDDQMGSGETFDWRR